MIEELTRPIDDRMSGMPEVASALRQYLETLFCESADAAISRMTSTGIALLPDRVFETLASREFCSVSLGRVAGCRDRVVASVTRALHRVEPIHFYYDLGGGYATSFRSGAARPQMDVGLGELLLLRQVTQLSTRIRQCYPVGIRFSLVIDNLSAFLVEDVPLTDTAIYCRNLRRLVDDLGLSSLTDLIVTSEYFSVSDFAAAWPRGAGVQDLAVLTNKSRIAAGALVREHETVDECECVVHAARRAAERLLAPMIRGVHLSERSMMGSLGFRPFPGGEASPERGEIVLTRAGRTALAPMRLTAANHADYRVERHGVAGILPSTMLEVGYAERVRTGEARGD
jgi:hypothetical protein